MRTKTIMYLSIIVTAYFVGKLFNPIPFTNYALYIIVTALFIPYFGKWNCLKIVLSLATISMIQDIPFLITIYKTWPSIYQGIFTGISDIMPNSNQDITIINFKPNFTPLIISPLLLNYLLSSITINDIKTLIAIEGNGLTTISLFVSGFYLTIINAFYLLSKAYRKIGVYRRISF